MAIKEKIKQINNQDLHFKTLVCGIRGKSSLNLEQEEGRNIGLAKISLWFIYGVMGGKINEIFGQSNNRNSRNE